MHNFKSLLQPFHNYNCSHLISLSESMLVHLVDIVTGRLVLGEGNRDVVGELPVTIVLPNLQCIV